jgi:hypothetical protein
VILKGIHQESTAYQAGTTCQQCGSHARSFLLRPALLSVNGPLFRIIGSVLRGIGGTAGVSSWRTIVIALGRWLSISGLVAWISTISLLLGAVTVWGATEGALRGRTRRGNRAKGMFPGGTRGLLARVHVVPLPVLPVVLLHPAIGELSRIRVGRRRGHAGGKRNGIVCVRGRLWVL